MDSDTSAAEAALKAKLSRKRTKTGCLTCRKRRIKCGEERPVCKNCIKSKRQCEGYSQRVVFRPPTFDYRPAPHGGAHITFPLSEPETPYAGHYAPPGFDPAFYRYEEAPQPDGSLHQGQFQHGVPVLQGPPVHRGSQSDAQVVHQHKLAPPSPAFYGPDGRPLQFAPAATPNVKEEPQHDAHHAQFGAAAQGIGNSSSADAAAPGPSNWQQYNPPRVEDTVRTQQIELTPSNDHFTSATRRQSVTFQAETSAGTEQPSPIWRIHGYTPRPEYQRPIDYQPRPAAASVPPRSSFAKAPAVQPPPHVPQDLYANGQTTAPSIPSHFLTAAAVEAQDDDYYDVQSDDEMDYEDSPVAMTDAAKQRRLTQLLQRHSISVQEVQMRRYDTFMYDGILDHYRVDDHANPLRNRATAMVFAHFIAVTGPSLSIFERHVRNSSVLFSEGQIPFPQQGLWTYTLPLAALRHRGLLHAMLAVASLHIARLQNASQTPSMQHYSWAVKRIRHCVGHPKKRLKVTTIAASMLLGFYEIMTADHTKWNMHLAGSKQLFLELEFGDMVRGFRRMKRDRAVSQMYSDGSGFPSPFPQSNDELLDQMYDVDERLVSQIVGKEVQYEKYGYVMTPQSSIPPDMDLGKFAMLKDLWWWYCKQDVYQSIVSGNPLLLDYSRWSNCPPRAPLGHPDAVYGSFDHLMLLLGRIADFAARDRARKLKQMEANGGQWRPPPGMKMPAPPAPPTPVSATNGAHGLAPEFAPPPTPSQKPPELPPFFGMAPPPRTNVTVPFSYMPFHGMSSGHSSPQQEIGDLEAATLAAKEEHGRIRAALFTFQNSLGEGFQPLSSEYQQELDTPFGKALFFRSYDIGCLWAIFHMATIITIRSHPDMHPAAHAAAAIAAHETAFQANEIGRIAAGSDPGLPEQPLNPTLGATLCESCMPSFFAAIQYQTAAQRHATVTRMHNIAQRTGWGSIELIANGCETSWVKAAAAGRGPPYARVARHSKSSQSSDPRLNGSWERLDPEDEPDEGDEGDRRLVRRQPAARLKWAIGIMGTEEDVVMG